MAQEIGYSGKKKAPLKVSHPLLEYLAGRESDPAVKMMYDDRVLLAGKCADGMFYGKGSDLESSLKSLGINLKQAVNLVRTAGAVKSAADGAKALRALLDKDSYHRVYCLPIEYVAQELGIDPVELGRRAGQRVRFVPGLPGFYLDRACIEDIVISLPVSSACSEGVPSAQSPSVSQVEVKPAEPVRVMVKTPRPEPKVRKPVSLERAVESSASVSVSGQSGSLSDARIYPSIAGVEGVVAKADDSSFEGSASESRSPQGGRRSFSDVSGYSSSMTRTYLNEMGRHEIPSVEEQEALCRRIAKGDESARNRLIEGNLRLVVRVAKKFKASYDGPLIELIQAGNHSLIRAAEKYDVDSGYTFATYAEYWISEGIKRAIQRVGLMDRPYGHVVIEKKVLRVMGELGINVLDDPAYERIATHLNDNKAKYSINKMTGKVKVRDYSVSQLKDAIMSGAFACYDSLDVPLGTTQRMAHESVEDENSRSPYVITSSAEASRYMLSFIDFLSYESKDKSLDESLAHLEEARSKLSRWRFLVPSDVRVLKMVYGLDGRIPMSEAEVARQLGVTRADVNAQMHRAMKKLRHPDVVPLLKKLMAE